MKRNLNRKMLNVVTLHPVHLNRFGVFGKKKQMDSDIPSGYELFKASDGDFKASDGEVYVKV